ncbi:MAG: hypothetical protein CMN76_01660 [Spirochaetaceae bacterium]|nr:hypothetical protein [Spirochaetaceae bacterium]
MDAIEETAILWILHVEAWLPCIGKDMIPVGLSQPKKQNMDCVMGRCPGISVTTGFWSYREGLKGWHKAFRQRPRGAHRLKKASHRWDASCKAFRKSGKPNGH